MEISEIIQKIEEKRKTKETIKMHPYGFIQLSLSDTSSWRSDGYRLHVWSEELPPMKRPDFAIHSHIYDVTSTILLGALKDTRYVVEDDPNGRFLIFAAHDGKMINTGKRISYDPEQETIFSQGNTYHIPKDEYHTSESLAPLTATLFLKNNSDESDTPKVIGPDMYAETEILSDERSFDQTLAWNIIDEAYERIKQTYAP